MKILFWNCAGTKSDHYGHMSEATTLLPATGADVIVIGEVHKGYRRVMRDEGSRHRNHVPGRWQHYSIIKPDKALGTYLPGRSGDPANQKRYLVLVRTGIACNAFYVPSGAPRPAVVIDLVQGQGSIFRIMAIHAPSVSSTYKPQAKAIQTALGNIQDLGQDIRSRLPNLILGDVNINTQNNAQTTGFMTYRTLPQVASIDAYYRPLIPANPTHRKPSGAWNTLDWALVPNASPADAYSIQNYNMPEDLEPDMMDTDDDDPMDVDQSYRGIGALTQKSDHMAILVTTP